MYGSGPWLIWAHLLFQLGENRGVAGEIRRISGAKKVAEEKPREPGSRPCRVAHWHAARDCFLAMSRSNFPKQIALDHPGRVDPPVQGVMPMLQELEDAVLP